MAYKNFKSTEIIEEIGAVLRKVRLAKGITINYVADQLTQSGFHISSTLLSRIENGVRRLDDDALEHICAFYDIDPREVAIAASKEHIRRLADSEHALDYEMKLDGDESIDILFENLNQEGQREVSKLMRMMSYMDAFKKI